MKLFLSFGLMACTVSAQTPAPAPAKTATPKPAPGAPAPPRAAAPKSVPPKATAAAPKPSPAKKTAASAKPPAPSAVPSPLPATDEEKTIYALGLSLFRSIRVFDLSPTEVELIRQAVADAAAQKPAIELEQWGPRIQELAMARSQRVGDQNKTQGVAFATKAATEPGATKTDSGLVYRELTAGSGASPAATDTVKVNYRGTLIDGTEFDSSYKRNEPAQFPLSGVIRCWTEGVQKMKTGGKSQLVCPPDLAYGDRGQGPIPAGSTLIFEIELLEIAPKQ